MTSGCNGNVDVNLGQQSTDWNMALANANILGNPLFGRSDDLVEGHAGRETQGAAVGTAVGFATTGLTLGGVVAGPAVVAAAGELTLQAGVAAQLALSTKTAGVALAGLEGAHLVFSATDKDYREQAMTVMGPQAFAASLYLPIAQMYRGGQTLWNAGAKAAESGGQQLFRVVNNAERASVESSGKFTFPARGSTPTGQPGKFFWSSLDEAKQFQQIWYRGGEQSHILQTTIGSEVKPWLGPTRTDGIGQPIFVELPDLTAPINWVH